MEVNFIAIAGDLAHYEFWIKGTRIGNLQIGPAFLVLQRLQRRVIPAAFPSRNKARRPDFFQCVLQRDLPAMRGDLGNESIHCLWRDHGEDRI